MKYCTSCLQPDTRPNTQFTNEGLCPACNYYEQCISIDWEERFTIIRTLADQYKERSSSGFDCLIGVSGGKDSTRQALWARDKLGLNPLLVCLTYPPEQITSTGAANISNLIELGFDVVNVCPQPQTWRQLLKVGFSQFTNWAKVTEQAIIASAPIVAIQYDIPLILWGENPGLQLGDLGTLGKTGYDGNNLRNMNTVSGGNLDWLFEQGFNTQDMILFNYPSFSEFAFHDIQIVYLGWFWNDWSLTSNGLYSACNGLQIRDRSVEDTGDVTKVTSLDEDWVTLNQMIKYYKFGFGRVTDYVNEAIRRGEITREYGIELCSQYDGSCSSDYIESFCEYIDISVQSFWQQVHKSCNKELFEIAANGTIHPKFTVGVGL